MKQKKVVIIGGGLGGIAAALRLAATGWQVTVCEQGARLGGKMNVWECDGFRFDTGPSLITMPLVFEELFKVAGSALAEHIELAPMRPLSDYVFADGTRFTYTSSLPEWLATLRELEPRDVDGFLRFMRLGARLYALSKETFLRRRPVDAPDMKSLRALRHLPLRYGWGNYHRTVAAHFKNPSLRQLFDRYPTYVGSSPYASPATLAVIPYIEYAFGGWHIKGGLYRLVESLVALSRAMNVEILTDTRVERIEHDGKRVSGVRLADGTRLEADALVMNGDAATTGAMLGQQKISQTSSGKISQTYSARSLSGFVMLVGVGRKLPQLSHHTIYFSRDYPREFSQLFNERRFPDDPTIYVSAPSRTDDSLAPSNGETLFIMANAPANDETWTERQIEQARERVFERLSKSGFPEIESDIIVSDVWTPQRIARDYLMPGGAIYGTHSHGWRRAFLRPPNKDANIGGLYYVGGSTHPGGGTPTVLLSAKITCELIERYENGKG